MRIYSDDVSKRSPGVQPRPGYILTNQRKRACIDKMRQFLATRSVSVSTRFVGRDGIDLKTLHYQMVHYEYIPVKNKTTGILTHYEYSGKAHGPDDMATIFFSAVGLAAIFMATSASPMYRHAYNGDTTAIFIDSGRPVPGLRRPGGPPLARSSI